MADMFRIASKLDNFTPVLISVTKGPLTLWLDFSITCEEEYYRIKEDHEVPS